MPKTWTEDTAFVDSLAANLCEAAVTLPRQLLRMDVLAHTHGMPFSHLQIIMLLSGGPRTISRISAALGIAKPNITPLLDQLSARGLVERVREERDRRIVNVHLTDEGWALMKKIRVSMAEQVMTWEERFGKNDIKRFHTALATLLGLVSGEGLNAEEM